LVAGTIGLCKSWRVAIAQYNTLATLKTEQLGPYPLEISRDRVTEENAEVRILAPNHPLMDPQTNNVKRF